MDPRPRWGVKEDLVEITPSSSSYSSNIDLKQYGSFKHSTELKAGSLAATSPACSERCNRRRGGEVAARRDKKYQRFCSALTAWPDKGPSPCLHAGADSTAAPQTPAPSPLCSQILGELLEKQQQQGAGTVAGGIHAPSTLRKEQKVGGTWEQGDAVGV